MRFLSFIDKRSADRKTAVFSDVHANLEALEAVLLDAKQNGASHFVCLGDIVGYGADPSACIQRVREVAKIVVKGNHDEYCSGGHVPADVNPSARETILWTKKNLTQEESDWILDLPMRAQDGELAMAHSTFEPGQHWPYIFNAQNAEPSLELQPAQIAFYGHTHCPVAFIRKRTGKVFRKKVEKIRIKRGCRYLINPGSVGQPRDGDPRASYALCDFAKRLVTLRRVEYSIELTAGKIRKAGLPALNADRLSLGK